jgi:uncharacterized protein YbcI
MSQSQSTMARQIAQAAVAFEQQRTGNHLPESVTVVLNDSALVVILPGALLPAEKALAQTPAGAAQVQEFYRQLFNTAAETLRKEIERITGLAVLEAAPLVQAFTTGTVVQVFLLDGKVATQIWSGSPSGTPQSPGPTNSEER